MLKYILTAMMVVWGIQTKMYAQSVKYMTGDGDGHSLSEIAFSVSRISGTREICRGENAVFQIFVKGSSSYTCKWIKIEDRRKVFEDSLSLILPACNGEEEGHYFCEVTDIRSGYTLRTDTIFLQIHDYSEIQLAVSRTKIAAGDQVVLMASGASHYLWSNGKTASQITETPQTTTVYRVKGYEHEVCVREKEVKVEVMDLYLETGYDRIISAGEELTLTAFSNTDDISWYSITAGGRRQFIKKGDKLTVGPLQTTVYEAEAVFLGVRRTAQVMVYVKAGKGYMTGLNDGFALSEVGFTLGKVSGETDVCFGADLVLNVYVKGSSAYQCAWHKLEGSSDQEMGADSSLLQIRSCEYADSGRYYCRVTDIRSGYTLHTDTVSVQVLTVPDLKLSASVQKIAEGGSVTLTGSGATHYLWSTGQTDPEIIVSPLNTTTYHLKGYHAEACASDTSVTIEVVRMDLEVGADRYISKGDTVELCVQTALDPVKWYRVEQTPASGGGGITENRIYIGEGKNIRISPDSLSIYEAEVEFGGIRRTDRLTVYVKNALAYVTGVNDGFALSEVGFTLGKVTGETDVCLGADLVLNVSVKGSSAYQYAWHKLKGSSDQEMDADSSLLQIRSCEYADSGRYYCRVTDIRSGYTLYTDTVSVQVLTVPDLKLSASVQKIAEGGSVTLTGSGATHYLWSTGQTDPEIIVSPLNTTTYHLKGYHAEACASDTSITIEVVRMDLEVGADRYISKGDTVELWAQTALDPVKWYRVEQIPASGGGVTENRIYIGEGKNIRISPDSSGIYEAEVEFGGIRRTDRLTVYVKNALAYVTGVNDGFTLSAVSFKVSPVSGSLEVCQGEDAFFSVSVTGSGAYAYQWRKYSASGDQFALADSNRMFIRNCQLRDTLYYYCEVTDLISGMKQCSDTVKLSVKLHPAVHIGAPADQTMICYGREIRLDARDTEFGNIFGDRYDYFWIGEGVRGRRDSAVVVVAPEEDATYILSVGNGECYGRDTVHILVNKPFVDLPSQLVATIGEQVEVKALTFKEVSLEWYVGDWYSLAQTGSSSQAFRYPFTQPTMIYVRTNDKGCEAIDSCRVLVRSNYGYMTGANDGFTQSCVKPTIVESSPAEIAGCTADVLEIGITVEATKAVYIWQKEVNYDFVDFAPLAGTNVTGLGGSNLRFAPPRPEDEGLYRCIVKNECGEVVSDTFAVSVGGRPVFRTRLNRDWNQCIYSGSAEMAVYATSVNDMPLEYAWYKDGVKLKGEAYTRSGISIPLDDVSREGWYKVTVANICDTIADSTFLPVYVPAMITKVNEGGKVYVCEGGNAEFQVEVTGGGDYYADLYRVTEDVGQSLGYVFNEKVGSGLKVAIPAVDRALHGTKYVWIAHNDCGADTSQVLELLVEKKPVILSVSQDTALCAGERLTLKCTAEESLTAMAYSWYHNGIFTGFVGPVYEKGNVGSGDAGNYVCYVQNRACTERRKSENIQVTVKEKAAVSSRGIYVESEVVNTQQEYCVGTAIRLKVDVLPVSVVDSMRWYKDGQPIAILGDRILRSDTAVLEIDSLVSADAGAYTLHLYNGCGVLQVVPLRLKVLEPARFLRDESNLTDMTLCAGEDQALSVKTSGTPPVRYTWTHNGNVVADGYSSVLKLEGVSADTSGQYCCEIHNGCAMPEIACAEIKVSRPDTFRLEGGGGYCVNAEEGGTLTLNGSDTTTVYRLYKNGVEVAVKDGREVISGAPIRFEHCKAGVYYVTGTNWEGCEFRMPGTVTIRENPAPVVYDLLLERHYCEGTNGGQLKLSGSEANPDLFYTLLKEETTGWLPLTMGMAGDGNELSWDRLKEGVYKVVAENRLTGCKSDMNGIYTLQQRSRPTSFDLLAWEEDTTYCAGSVSDVRLYLSGSEPVTTYTLYRNRLETVATGTDTTWGQLEEGVYSVVARNQWGCETESGYKVVKTRKLPVVTLQGGAVFCPGDTTLYTLEVGGLQEENTYIIYREEPQEEYGRLENVSGSVRVKVPAEAKSYYVVATDGSPEACRAESQRVEIRKSDFIITANSPVVIGNGETAVLAVTIEGGIAPFGIVWSPGSAIAGDPTAATVTTLPLQKGSTYTVSVQDGGGCIQKASVDVVVTGTELTLDIREADRVTSVDTVRLCRNERLTLYGAYDGGNGSYQMRWYSGTDAAIVENTAWLKDYQVTKTGNLYFEVKSGEIVRNDTVFVELLDTARHFEFTPDELLCTTNIKDTLHLAGSERDVRYGIEYDPLGSGVYELKGNWVTGTGGPLELEIADAVENTGYYRIRADKFVKGQVCHSYMLPVEIRRAPQVFVTTGGGIYCETEDREDTVRLSGGESNVSYQLVRRSGQIVAGKVGEDGQEVIFAGNWGDGVYRIKGIIGRCEAWMEDSVVIKVNPLPADCALLPAGNYCESDPMPIAIGLINGEADVEYTLYRDRLGTVTSLAVKEGPGAVDFGNFRSVGEYYVVARHKVSGCQRLLTNRVKIGSTPVAFTVEGGNEYPWGAEVPETTLKAYKVKAGVEYHIYSLQDVFIGSMDSLQADTLYYTGKLPQGGYVVRAEAGSCVYQPSDTVWVKAVVIPYPIVGDTLYCETDAYAGVEIGIGQTQKGVVYILQKQQGTTAEFADVEPRKVIYGSGHADRFEGLFKAGVYRIVADNGMRQLMEGVLTVKSRILPDVQIPLEITGNVCTDSTVRLALHTQSGVNYQLYHNGMLTTQPVLAGDGNVQSWMLQPAEKGTYRIKADNGDCEIIFPEEIEAGDYPSVGVLEGDTLLCSNVGGELYVRDVEPGVVYILYSWDGLDTIRTGQSVGNDYRFTGVLPGTYYAEASRGGCRHRSNEHTIRAIPAVDFPADFTFSYSECVPGGEGWIRLKGMEAGQSYCLFGASLSDTINIEGSEGERLIQHLPWGEYTVIAAENGRACQSSPLKVNLREPAPEDTLTGDFSYCVDEYYTRLSLSGFTTGAEYTIYAESGEIYETLKQGMTFKQNYMAGKYVLEKVRKGVFESCVARDSFEIFSYPKPSAAVLPEITGESVLCAGGRYQIGLQASEAGVIYTLRRTEGREVTDLDTVMGDGGDVQFERILTEGGFYRIYAQRGENGCGLYLDSLIHIQEKPAAVLLENGDFCEGERGAALRIAAMENEVRYILHTETHIPVDTLQGPGEKRFMEQGEGTYYVVAEDLRTSCRDTMDFRPIIRQHVSPRLLTLFPACASVAEVSTQDVSEGDTVVYRLYRNQLAVEEKTGNKARLNFGVQTIPGVYKIKAENNWGCSRWMNDSVIVYNRLADCGLRQEGDYCSGNERIVLHHDCSVPGWNYYLERLGLRSDTLAGNNGEIAWDTLNRQRLFPATYRLHAYNACKDTLLAEYRIVPARLPQEQTIAGTDVFCGNEGFRIVLESTEADVQYRLVFVSSGGTETWLDTADGTGGQLQIGDVYTTAGRYRVYGHFKGSSCESLVAEKAYIPGTMPRSRYLTGKDVCLDGVAEGIELGISERDKGVVYYLQKIATGEVVDTLDETDPAGVNFAIQHDTACYQAYAVNKQSGCQAEVEGVYCLSLPPQSFKVENPGDTVWLCVGESYCVRLDSSETTAKYQLLKNGSPWGGEVVGTGRGLEIGCVNAEGIYRVYARNGCNAMMDDSLVVKVNSLPLINREKEFYRRCENGDSVTIRLSAPSRTDVYYTLTDPAGRLIDGQYGTGDAVVFRPGQVAGGFYRITAADRHCQRTDSVEVRIDSLPRAFRITADPNTWLCVGGGGINIRVEQSEPNASYTLWQGNRIWATFSAMDTEGVVFKQVNEPGKYKVVATYRNEQACQQDMLGLLDVKNADTIRRFELLPTKRAYCYTDEEKGTVTLSGSEAGIEYELYRDGVATGQIRQGTGDILCWMRLEGKSCEECAQNDKGGYSYTVMGRDPESGCVQRMNGSVNILQESDVKVLFFHPNKNIDVCRDSSVDFTVVADGCMLNYRWYHSDRSGVTVDLDTNAPYFRIPAAREEDYGTYWCEVTNACSVVGVTSAIEVRVRRPMQVKADRDVSVCDTKVTTARLEAIYYGTTYKWYKVGEEDVVLGRTQVLELKNITAASSGRYVCVAANECNVLRDTCELRVGLKPAVEIVKAVTDTLCRGEAYELEVSTADSVVWQLNGTDLPYSGNRYSISAVTPEDAGHYSVKVVGGCEELLVNMADLYVDDTIRVKDIIRGDQVLCEGGKVNLYIETEPSERVKYEWFYAGRKISDNKAFEYGPLAASNTEYTFRVYFRNTCELTKPGEIDQPDNYRDVRVRVNEKADIGDPVAEIVTCAEPGLDTVIRIDHSYMPGMTFAWYRFQPGADTLPLLGATADSVVVALTVANRGYYFCRVNNGCEVVATNACVVNVDTTPMINGYLENDTLCEGEDLNLLLAATGGSLDYEWKVRYPNGREEVIGKHFKADFSTTDQMTIRRLTMIYDSAQIWCHVSNHCDEEGVNSDTMLLRVRARRSVRLNSDTISVCESDGGLQEVGLETGVQPWRYRYADAEGRIFERYCLSRTDTLLLTDAGHYRIVYVEDSTGCGESSGLPEWEVIRYSAPLLSLNGGGERCYGDTVSLRLSVSGGVGPWRVQLARRSGGLATELMEEQSSLLLYGRDTVLRWTVTYSEDYYVYGHVVDEGTGCEGIAPENDVNVAVHVPLHIDFRSGWSSHIGQCKDINLREFLLPSVEGNPVSEGMFYVNGKSLNGDFWLRTDFCGDSCYLIVYRYTDEFGCEVTSDEIQICVDSLPYGEIVSPSFVCESLAATFDLQLYPVGGIDSVVLRHTRYKEQASGLSPSVRRLVFHAPDISREGMLSIPLNWDMVGGADSCQVFEVLNIRDVHGCSMADGNDLGDTVWRRWDPAVEIESRLKGESDWVEGRSVVSIVKGDSVEVRVRLVRGLSSWSLPLQGVEHINGRDTVLWLKEEGHYVFRPEDDFCGRHGMQPWPELEVVYVDTGYFRGRLFLEGPFDWDNGDRMHSLIGHSLGLPSSLPLKPSGLEVIDWIGVEIRTGSPVDSVALLSDSSYLVGVDSCLLLSNGQLADRWSGDTLVGVRNACGGGSNYRYVVIRHRNHLGVMSRRPVRFLRRKELEHDDCGYVDFSKSGDVYCRDGYLKNHMSVYRKEGMEHWLLSAGEVNRNDLVTLYDPNRLLKVPDLTLPYDVLFDVNFDGRVDWPGWNGRNSGADYDIVKRNRQKFTEIKL